MLKLIINTSSLAKLPNLNHTLEVVSRYRETQLQECKKVIFICLILDQAFVNLDF